MYSFTQKKSLFPLVTPSRCLLLQLTLICLLVPAHRAESAEIYGINLIGVTQTVDSEEHISATATGADDAIGANLNGASTLNNSGSLSGTSDSGRAYGARLDTNSTLNNSGSSSATSNSDRAYGALLDNNSTLINSGSLSGTSGTAYGYGIRADNHSTVDNSGSLSATGDRAYGVYLDNSSTLRNSGTISSTGNSRNSYGIYAGYSTLNNSGSSSATNDSSQAHGMALYYSQATNSGSSSATSKSNFAIGASVEYSTLTNSGSISATSESGTAVGTEVEFGTLINSGSISATGPTFFAIVAASSSNIHLQTGSNISGQVFGNDNTSNLFIEANSNLSFALTGAWNGLNQSGSGIWEIASGSSATANTLNQTAGTLQLPASGQIAATAPLKIMGTATLAGTLAVESSATSLGAPSVIMTAGTLDTSASTFTSANPNFSVARTDNDSSGTVTVTTSFTPQDDQSSLAATATLSAAHAFAGVAQARSLTLLADAGSKSKDDEIMVASSGSLTGLLEPRTQEILWGMYVQPVFSSSSRDSSTDSAGYDAHMAGLEVGIDRQFGDNWVFGVMAGIGTGNIDFKGSTFVDSDSEDQDLYTMGMYAGYRLANWTFADTLSATYAKHDSDRNAGFGQTAKADYDSWLTTNQLLAIYHWQLAEHWEITPRAGLNITHLHRDGFSETGAINAVSYDDLDKTFADGTLEVRAKYDYLLEDTKITPYVGAGLVHSMGNGDITVRQYLPTTSAQVTNENDSNRLTSECGVTFGKGSTSLTVAYSGEYGETMDSHSLFGMLRWAF